MIVASRAVRRTGTGEAPAGGSIQMASIAGGDGGRNPSITMAPASGLGW